MPAVGIYCRQSIEKEDSCSLDIQQERCTGITKYEPKYEGWDIKVYVDSGYSGKDTDRPGYQDLMADVRAGIIKVVVVYKIDRISRNLLDFFNFVEELQDLGVEFRSVSESFDTSSPIGRAFLGILAVFAQFERETIAERVRDNMLGRARLGAWNGGPVPFGFTRTKTTIHVNDKPKQVSILEAIPEERSTVLEIFHGYLKPGMSLISLCKELNERGLRTRSGALWRCSELLTALVLPQYLVRLNTD